MFFALNEKGIRIDAHEAIKGQNYFCPICNNRVVLKKGSIIQKMKYNRIFIE